MIKTVTLNFKENGIKEWKAFLWYISDFIRIEFYDSHTLKYRTYSINQERFINQKILEYNEEIAVSNYEIDIKNDLWKSHKSGGSENMDILLGLIKS